MSLGVSIYIGTSGWSYPKGEGTWKGFFYPPGKINELEYYSQFFNTVELNSSFYRPPDPGYVYNWAKTTCRRISSSRSSSGKSLPTPRCTRKPPAKRRL